MGDVLMDSAEPTESIEDRVAWLLYDDFTVDSHLCELLSFFSGLANSSTHLTSATDVNDWDLPVKKLDKPLLREGRLALRDFMWKRGPPLPSGVTGGENSHEEFPLSIMSSAEVKEPVESDEQTETEEEEDEDK